MFLFLLQVVTEPPALRFDGVVDVYASVGDPAPGGGVRSWLTQPREDRAFALNLATLGVTRTSGSTRLRLALQTGSSVVANYAGENDPTAVRPVEEAYVGLRPTPALWLDAGIFGSAIGQESWRSTENPTYTRSLTAEYTPYYSAGLRATWTPSATLTLRGDLLNGWQRIGENNRAKTLSARLDWSPAPRLLLGGSGAIGNERPDSLQAATRRFGQVYARVGAAPGPALWLTADLGAEGGSTFGSTTLIATLPAGTGTSVALRTEYYADRDQVLFATGTAEGFAGIGASVGVDRQLAAGVTWRTEARWFRADAPVFTGSDGGPPTRTASFLVSALTARWSAAP